MRERNDVTAHARAFDRAADVYEAARPSYPQAAVDWLVPSTAKRVLDLGAGTGKLTRLLVDRALDVVAVDPSAQMLGVFERALHGIRTHLGSAEDIPLGDASVDAVVSGQAWHWVDPVRAVPEVARVLRPGGTLGLVWNSRDESVDWVAELGRRIGGDVVYAPANTPPRVGAPFGPLETFAVHWKQELTPEGLLDLVRSRSYFITKEADEQLAVLESVRRLVAEHPSLAGRDTIEMPYITECYRTALPIQNG
ncbi:methyltransferase domain-containing protein [Diaminobutyricibacter tongyongensis]|uniref:Methyltransferase domain-containing protein n=1 Tax=Leifsonia tongyongensis TaxID=1268043 RepID=A0A6L9Y100_9MICO|nr:class I SAM-dependent methyltransferase [Diaminobutyricibacter tongyongensis]NEN07246.1 methyltransferase domain-containing protein [Diaminobutyricibacter tongyongensis]